MQGTWSSSLNLSFLDVSSRCLELLSNHRHRPEVISICFTVLYSLLFCKWKHFHGMAQLAVTHQCVNICNCCIHTKYAWNFTYNLNICLRKIFTFWEWFNKRRPNKILVLTLQTWLSICWKQPTFWKAIDKQNTKKCLSSCRLKSKKIYKWQNVNYILHFIDCPKSIKSFQSGIQPFQMLLQPIFMSYDLG